MLFSSFEYIFLFLPLVFIAYFFLNSKKLTIGSRIWLVLSSLLFYAYWKTSFLPVILISFITNYIFGYCLARNATSEWKKYLIICGLCFNVFLLAYYKYSDFVIANINLIFNIQFHALNIDLPLGISFFTFTQIAYLVDVYRQKVKEYSFLNYALFVTYFPHLLAGPIIHHSEMMPQFYSMNAKVLRYKNVWKGIFLFTIGLFKKIVIADTFAVWANQGFDHSASLSCLQAWATSFAYTFQLYFDFSGYTDMAIGSSLLFNIVLPFNFNSPYKALDIQDFWRRWHITLSRFLKEYIYIPLGGNRAGTIRAYTNLMLTFLIGGLWHGAGWTFIFWGFLHGCALVIQRLWGKLDISMPKILAWFITFNFVNIAWVFFRAKTWDNAIKILSEMLNFSQMGNLNLLVWGCLFIGFVIALFFKNSNQLLLSKLITHRFAPIAIASVFACSIVFLNVRGGSAFIYFQF